MKVPDVGHTLALLRPEYTQGGFTLVLLPRPGVAEAEVFCEIHAAVSHGLRRRGFKEGDVVRIEAVR